MRPVIQGILAALVGMLVLVTLQMGAVTLTDLKSLALMAAASLALIVFKVNLLWIVGRGSRPFPYPVLTRTKSLFGKPKALKPRPVANNLADC